MIIAISITLFFIVLRFTVTLFNFVSNPKLTRVNKHYTDLVSILIPARNEAGNIIPLLQSIQLQDYKNYEVIVYAGGPTNDTYAICAAFAAEHPNFSVIKGGTLAGLRHGKNNACHELAKKAKGHYLLFLDDDETVGSGLINSSVHRMKLYRLGLLSLFANQEMQTIGEKITVPLLHYLLLNLLPLRLVFLAKNAAIATACAQFMLFDATAYRKNEWHKVVRDELTEDAEIMKLVKSAGYNGEVLLANGMITCRMYKSYRAAINGFSKNALATFNYSITGILIYLLLLIGGPMLVMMTLNFQLIFFMTGLIVLTRVMISLSAGQNALYNLFLHPVQMVNLILIAFIAIQKYLTRWVGRQGMRT